MNKAYIGDAVYVEIDASNQVKLTTGDGNNMVIYMDISVVANFLMWLRDSGYVNNNRVAELFSHGRRQED